MLDTSNTTTPKIAERIPVLEAIPVAALGDFEVARHPKVRDRATVAQFLLASVLLFAATIPLSIAFDSSVPSPIAIAGFGLVTLCGLLGASLSFVTLTRPTLEPPSAWGGIGIAILGLTSLFMAGLGYLLTLWSTVGFSRGRQLRHFGRAILPKPRTNDEWADSSVSLGTSEPPPAGLAQQWRENGKTEHASVAAFAGLTLDLIALGAPPSLIAAANQDALDEIRHAEICFSLARALDGECESPGPFPEAQRAKTLPRSRTLALAKLAVDSLVDGALNEGVSARIIASLARRCEVSGVRERLKEIAADEGRHAAHGWTVVKWCLEQGGRPVADALHGAARALPHQMNSELPEAARDGSWERWGIHGSRREDEAGRLRGRACDNRACQQGESDEVHRNSS